MTNQALGRGHRPSRGGGPLRAGLGRKRAAPLGMRPSSAGLAPRMIGGRPRSLVAPDPAMHVLHRLTFGASQKEIAKIARLGIQGWIEKQLDYTSIIDDGTEAQVAAMYPDLGLPIQSILAFYETDEERFWYHPYQLKKATILRALSSKRQLYEVMVEFWSNHFNVYHENDWTRWFKTLDDRKVARKHALGRFRDLLKASARSPAMLFYLDNFLNPVDGFNENYARELMELHTLGVDGGYTQADVVAVARCFTGWTIDWNYESPTFGHFRFEPEAHDYGAKTVLGHAIPAGQPGTTDGLQVLDLLASHPSTARTIAFKLCRRFVADTPPASLVNAAAATFLATDGDIRAILRTIFASPEFMAAADQKFKRPFEWLLSALRALGATATDAGLDAILWWLLEPLGQMPFDWAPPNGYPDVGGAWMNTNGLMNRWNVSSYVAFGWVDGVTFDLADIIAAIPVRTPGAMVDALAQRFLQRPLDAADRQVFVAYAGEGRPADQTVTLTYLLNRAPGLVALFVSSPHFQWR